MTMIDDGKKDHKIIAVATGDPEFKDYHKADELPPHRLNVLRRFFQDYKQLEHKAVEVDEIAPAEKSYPIIEDALHRYSDQRGVDFHNTSQFSDPLARAVPVIVSAPEKQTAPAHCLRKHSNRVPRLLGCLQSAHLLFGLSTEVGGSVHCMAGIA
jgi:hypothetical protein